MDIVLPKDPKEPKEPEVKICGVNAVLSMFENRKDDIIRISVREKDINKYKHILKYCSEAKKAYHLLDDESMGKVAETVHHEGVCVLAKQKRSKPFGSVFAQQQKKKKSVVIFLDNVSNPHNLGAIVRVAAHFGCDTILTFGDTPSRYSTAVYRTAEGAAEAVDLVPVDDAARALKAYKSAGFKIVATSATGKQKLFKWNMPEKVVFLLGSESQGLSKAVASEADENVSIPGTGHVESLNVACATSTLLGEYWRQQG